jgi:hypothetical protein
MNIDKVNRLNSISKPAGRGPVGKTSAARGKDTVSLSPEALRNAEMRKTGNSPRPPDIRMDRVNGSRRRSRSRILQRRNPLRVFEKIAGRRGYNGGRSFHGKGLRL